MCNREQTMYLSRRLFYRRKEILIDHNNVGQMLLGYHDSRNGINKGCRKWQDEQAIKGCKQITVLFYFKWHATPTWQERMTLMDLPTWQYWRQTVTMFFKPDGISSKHSPLNPVTTANNGIPKPCTLYRLVPLRALVQPGYIGFVNDQFFWWVSRL